MNTVLKIFLSMSVSGGLLILVLLLGKPFLKNKISRQWQYYIWLIVILRLLLPFGPETTLLGKTYQTVDQVITQAAPLPQQQSPFNIPAEDAAGWEQNSENAKIPAENSITVHPVQDIVSLLVDHIWLIWLAAAMGLLIQKLTIYQSFIRYINAGLTPVSDMEALDRLSVVMEQAGVKKPIELCVNPLVSSPMLIGFFRPCIVLPSTDVSEKDFQYIVMHELTHYKRQDMFYKWLVQAAVCLHWFNPLVYLMEREMTKACEFSCDEAVLAKMGSDNAQDYGKTLLNAMAAVRRYKENLGAVTLSENKQLLKERLVAIMNFKSKSKANQLLTGILTISVTFVAAFVGIYPVAAADDHITSKLQATMSKNPTQIETGAHRENDTSQAERYYKAGSLPLFQIAFSRLDQEAQEKWLDRIYADNQLAFFGAAVGLLDEDCVLLQRYAEKTYANGSIAYFSTLAMHMSEDLLEIWLDKALEDENIPFQSVLFNALDRGGEFDKLEEKQEKEWEEAHIAKYRAVGVTMEGKNYYYQGKLVHIFLDMMRPNRSFYTLDMNPAGTVNIKIVRNQNNEITGVAYMTEAEVTELLGDMLDPDDGADLEIIPVHLKTVSAGENISLGEYTLSEGDKIWYDIFAETGNGIQVFFAESERQDTVYWSVHSLRQKNEPLKCTADMTVEPPAKPGTYQLFLRASDGALGNVKGSISIFADA